MDVKTLCLGVLSRGPHSGYEIRKAFEDGPLSHFQDAGFGSIYPSLKKLSEDGAVSVTDQQQSGKPDKKVYSITPVGRELLFDAVTTPPAEDKYRSDFLFVMFFADLLAPRDLDALLDRRIQQHRTELAEMEAHSARDMTPGERFTLGYGYAHHHASLEYLENHRHEILGSLLQQKVAE